MGNKTITEVLTDIKDIYKRNHVNYTSTEILNDINYINVKLDFIMDDDSVFYYSRIGSHYLFRKVNGVYIITSYQPQITNLTSFYGLNLSFADNLTKLATSVTNWANAHKQVLEYFNSLEPEYSHEADTKIYTE